MTLTFEDHLREMTALLDAGLRISRDQGIPVAERLDEIGRLLGRIEGHRAAAEFLYEGRGEPVVSDAAGMSAIERCEPDGYMCPVCKHAAATSFSCGGPHPLIRKDGTPGKRRVYRFVQALPVRFCNVR